DDPRLVERVAAERIPLDVCPNSNVLIANRYASLDQHPFRRMRQAGLLVTLNTDDPAMTDLDLGKEYRSVAGALGMPWEEMCAVALDGVEASWLDEGEKRRMHGEFEAVIAGIEPPETVASV
ncbi:MAG TPA: hypothetical protein VFM38_14540, partial [Candidatus Limnocylindrales bacterium]|nr:hypothetical protein [Candidatus Limnocylindrales bacterium]